MPKAPQKKKFTGYGLEACTGPFFSARPGPLPFQEDQAQPGPARFQLGPARPVAVVAKKEQF